MDAAVRVVGCLLFFGSRDVVFAGRFAHRAAAIEGTTRLLSILLDRRKDECALFARVIF